MKKKAKSKPRPKPKVRKTDLGFRRKQIPQTPASEKEKEELIRIWDEDLCE